MDALTSHPLRGGKLHGIEAGPPDGPLVILLHGFPDFSWGWRKQIVPLAAAGFRVVAPDQRGYGHSDKPLSIEAYRLNELVADVIELADNCGHATFRLVGHDWGGIVAWATAARHPDRVEQLAVLNAPHPDAWSRMAGHRWKQMRKSWYVAFFQLPWLPELVLKARGFAMLRRTLHRSSRPGTFTRDDLELYGTGWAQPGALTAMLNYYRALRFRPAESLPRIQPKSLLLWGEQDAFLARAVGEASLQFCDDATALLLPEASHWLQLEEPEKVNAALLAFFRGEP